MASATDTLVQRCLTGLENSVNYGTIREFFDYLVYERYVGELRLTNYRRLLIRYEKFLQGKPFDKVTKADNQRFLLRNKKSDDQDSKHRWIGTYNTELIDLTTFYYWFYNRGKDRSEWVKPECVRIQPMKRVEDASYSENDIWTEEEVVFVASRVCDTPRDAFIVASPYDTAAIPKDLVNIRLGDLKLSERYGELTVKAKKRFRTNPLIISYPYARDLINSHPFRDNPDAYLIISQLNGKKIGARQIWYIWKRLKHKFQSMVKEGQFTGRELEIARRLLKKPWNPYIGRHSCLNSKSEYLNDSGLKRVAGWSANTKVPKRYLNKRDAIKPILQHYGIVEDEQGKKQILLNACPKCQHVNKHGIKFCEKCSFILDPVAWEEVKKEEADMKQTIQNLRNDMAEVKEYINRQNSRGMFTPFSLPQNADLEQMLDVIRKNQKFRRIQASYIPDPDDDRITIPWSVDGDHVYVMKKNGKWHCVGNL